MVNVKPDVRFENAAQVRGLQGVPPGGSNAIVTAGRTPLFGTNVLIRNATVDKLVIRRAWPCT